jgi:class 3 adenylate cyclase
MTPRKRSSQALLTYLQVLSLSIAIGLLSFFLTHIEISRRADALSLKKLYDSYERSILYRRFKDRLSRVSYKDPINPAIALIAVDEETLDAERLPVAFWSKNYVPVVRMLIDNGVKVIGFDFIEDYTIDESLRMIIDRQSLDRLKRSLEKSLGQGTFDEKNLGTWIEKIPENLPIYSADEELMGLCATKKIVLPAMLIKKNEKLLRSNPDLVLAAGWENLGIANLGSFEDEVILFERLAYRYCQDKSYEILKFTGGIAGGLWEEKSHPRELNAFATVLLQKLTGTAMRKAPDGIIKLGSQKIVVDDDEKLWINYRRPIDPRKDSHFYYSFKDVLNRAREHDKDYFRKNFADRMVLIGKTAFRIDRYKTPVVEKSWMSGSEIHAQLMSCVLDNDFLIIPDAKIKGAIIIMLCLLGGIITYYFKPWMAFLSIIAIVVLYLGAVDFLFIRHSILLETLSLLFVIPVIGSTYFYKFITEEKERQRTRNLFGRYVSKNVMESIMSNPGNLALGGTRRKVTILFSDINNFTPTSEKLSPEELMRYLNDYFDEMNAIIMKYNGTIKQFVGDEIMVIYGAPLEQEDQALLAVQTALDMVDRLREMRQRDATGNSGFYEVKIGIHTGEVVAGNVGSLERTEYAAVGDNVNLTSRIEGLNKRLHTTILISEETYQEVRGRLDNAEFISFEPQEVKGKEKPIQVYEVKRKL